MSNPIATAQHDALNALAEAGRLIAMAEAEASVIAECASGATHMRGLNIEALMRATASKIGAAVDSLDGVLTSGEGVASDRLTDDESIPAPADLKADLDRRASRIGFRLVETEGSTYGLEKEGAGGPFITRHSLPELEKHVTALERPDPAPASDSLNEAQAALYGIETLGGIITDRADDEGVEWASIGTLLRLACDRLQAELDQIDAAIRGRS